MACNMWSDISGSWTKTGGDARTTNNNALTVHQSSWTGLDDNCEPDDTMYAEAEMQSTAFDSALRIIVDYKDPSNFHFAEFITAPDALSDGSANLYKREAGADNPLGLVFIPFQPNTSITPRVCHDQETLAAVVGGIRIEADTPGHGGKRTGIGTGALNSGTAKFLSFEKGHNIYSPNCKDCEAPPATCLPCATATVPERLKVRFINVVSGDCSASLLAGSFILPRLDCDSDVPDSGASCPASQGAWADYINYGLTLSPALACGNPNFTVTAIGLNLYNLSGTNQIWMIVQLTVADSASGGATIHSFRAQWHDGVLPNCQNIVDVELPFHCESGAPAAAAYDMSGASAIVGRL